MKNLKVKLNESLLDDEDEVITQNADNAYWNAGINYAKNFYKIDSINTLHYIYIKYVYDGYSADELPDEIYPDSKSRDLKINAFIKCITKLFDKYDESWYREYPLKGRGSRIVKNKDDIFKKSQEIGIFVNDEMEIKMLIGIISGMTQNEIKFVESLMNSLDKLSN